MPDIDPWASYNPPQAQDQENDPWASYNPPDIELTDEKLKKQLAGGDVQATQDAITGGLNTGPVYTAPEEYTRPLGATGVVCTGRGERTLPRSSFVARVTTLGRLENVTQTGGSIGEMARSVAPPDVQTQVDEANAPPDVQTQVDEANAAAVRPDINPVTLGLLNKLGDAAKFPGDTIAQKLEDVAPKGIPSSSSVGDVEMPTGRYGAVLARWRAGGIVASIAAKIGLANVAGVPIRSQPPLRLMPPSRQWQTDKTRLRRQPAPV